MTQQEKRRIHKDFEWLGKNMPRLQHKYAGKFAAIVNKHVNVGKDAVEAYNKSQENYPGIEPLMTIIPKKECLLL